MKQTNKPLCFGQNVKEEAQHQHRLAERRCSELVEQLTEARTQLSDTAREKQAFAAELNILKVRADASVYVYVCVHSCVRVQRIETCS